MTISELIVKLSKYPPNKNVVIEDADTQWVGRDIHFTEYHNDVSMSIEYSEMDSNDDLGRSIGPSI